MTNKKPGGTSYPPPPSGAASVRPQVSSTGRPPSNVRDAMTEAHAIAGGALGRPVSTAPAALARKTVLIVDDDASMRQRLRAALQAFYDVVEAKDGMDAVERLGQMAPPAMVVSDVMMPRVDGFTLAKILRSNPALKKVPIMFVSARNSPQDVTQALGLGACQYIPKTTPMNDIVAKIRKIVV